VKALKIGNGAEPGTDIGPMIDMAAVEKTEEHIADALAKGATLLSGGHRKGGTFFEPTLVIGVTADMAVATEETFGPLAPVFRFETDAQVIEAANATRFGLAAYFYGQNLGRVFRLAEALEYGMVGINTGILSTEVAPFGGVKESGIGREGSKYGLDEYLETKYLCIGI
jgi:succinate-semialdehyde dehydrogenase/glutarate-semialdehyde dehydrogenase